MDMEWKTGNEMHSTDLAISISSVASEGGIIVLLKTLPNYRKLKKEI